MSNPPSLSRDPKKSDAEHLHLLVIFHYVLAGFALVGLLFLLAHYWMMSSVFSNPEIWQHEGKPSTPPPKEFFMVFIWFYVIGGIFLLAAAIANILSAIWIRARENRMFSLVVAGLNCLQVPFGTALGVFTIIVLSRDSVRELYAERALTGDSTIST